MATWPSAADLAAFDSSAPSYVLSVDIEGHEPRTVWEHVSNPENVKKSHPLIVDVKQRSWSVGEDGSVRAETDYTDNLSICGVACLTTYTATMYRPDAASSASPPKPLQVFFRTDTKGTTVKHRIECEPLQSGTRLRQTVFITAPWGLQWYVLRTARKAHQESLSQLPRFIGS